MITHADPSKENTSRSMAGNIGQNHGALQLVDNRPERVTQKKLQGMINESDQVAGARAYRQMAGDYAARTQSPIQAQVNNTGLPGGLKAGIEHISGYSMNDVKVHYNSGKPAQLHAHAYAQGTDIHVAPGQEKHLPHEAWHVVQQKQGRVKPTVQMKGKVNVNDDKGLEHEADVMGAKASGLGAGMVATIDPGSKRSLQKSAQSPEATMQAVWILRNGEPLWVQDPYVLQPGEEYLPFDYQPRVIFDKGRKAMSYDSTGASSVEKTKAKPPTHPKLQKAREKQGRELRKRLKNRSLGDLQQDVQQLGKLAGQLEQQAGDSAPKNHKKKVRKLVEDNDITGPKFRNMIKGQDEFTESEATASFLGGLGTSAGDTPPHYSLELENYEEETLRTMSSLRAPTSAIIAPIEHNGNVTGQQHPTETSIPKLQGGSSGHSYADRARVHAQNQTFDRLSGDKAAPPNALLLGSLLSAGSATLSGMSHPLSASNVPDFDMSMHDEQHGRREKIKAQVKTVASEISVPMTDVETDFDAPLTSHKAPASPKRLDKAATLARKAKAASAATTTTAPVTTSAAKPVLKELKSTQVHLVESVNHVIHTIQGAFVNHPWIVQRINGLNNIITQAQQADLSTQQSQQVLFDLYTPLNNLFHELEPYLARGVTEAGGDAFADWGNRVASLEQYMAECGQMAVHNLDAFEHAQANNAFGNLNARLRNEGNLRGRGNFENNIDEAQIRQMLATANRQGVPVIGNLGQLQTFVDQYNQFENAGQVFNLQGFGAQWLTDFWHLGPVEIREIQNMNHFIQGRSNQINFIINTDAHHQIAQGSHWITVRLERADDGRIRIFYTDSLRGIRYYAPLFQAMRAFVNNAHVQNAQQNAPASGKGGAPAKKP